jgi:ferrochelatase
LLTTEAKQQKSAVLLLAHGSPDKPEDVAEFFRRVSGGRELPAEMLADLKRRYAAIGKSPLREITLAQAQALERELEMPVYVGMRNWTPFIGDVVMKMAADRVQQSVVICLAPQNSRTSVGLYRRALMGESPPPFKVEFVESWHDHPLLIRAFSEKLTAGWIQARYELGTRVPIVFTAHSVPKRTIEQGDPYEKQARETAALVAREAGLAPEDWTFAFQSQSATGGPWLGPTVEETIEELKAREELGVFIQPIGFLSDHLEVLYDIDIAFRRFAEERGMRLWRAESPNTSPTLVSALADLARTRLGLPRNQKAQFNAALQSAE